MLAWLYEKVTGESFWTGRSAVDEFGPSRATRHADVLRGLTDWEVAMYGDRLVAAAEAKQAPVGASR
jgi:hypothetical protein